jgi:hypothetical protein
MKAPAGCGAESANIAALTIAPKTVNFRMAILLKKRATATTLSLLVSSYAAIIGAG